MYRYNTEKSTELFPLIVDKEVVIDYKLLFELLKRRSYSQSKSSKRFIKWLMEYCKGIEGVHVTKDRLGNLYVTKGDADLYPCVVAHTDINQEFVEKVNIVKTKEWIVGIDESTGLQCGLGADDKVGVYFGLEMLKRFDVIKVFFPADEEVGCVGTHGCDSFWFKDCTMLLQLDRNAYAGAEICTYTNGVEVASQEFIDAIEPQMIKYDYFESSGFYTDVGILKQKEGVECIAVNIGGCYYDEHSEQEVININAFENAINFGYEIIKYEGNKKFKHLSKGKSDKKNRWVDWKEEKDSWKNGVEYFCTHDIDRDDADEFIEEGICPCCLNDSMPTDVDGMSYCQRCYSYWNIPYKLEGEQVEYNDLDDMPF